MNRSIKPLSVVLIFLVAASVMTDVFQGGEEMGRVNFFQKHGFFFLFFITFLPRLTLLFSSIATGGFLWWVGFIFCPRVLIASLATVSYLHTNPVLVVMSWVIAIFGETIEKIGLGRGRKRFIFRTVRVGGFGHHGHERPYEHQEHLTGSSEDVIEAEFTKKS